MTQVTQLLMAEMKQMGAHHPKVVAYLEAELAAAQASLSRANEMHHMYRYQGDVLRLEGLLKLLK